ncbi:hypothetical protein [Pedobacter sp. MR2016-19]|uniref:hypothetical protein n=1 Tax=Pedobacter sp. MR2016-19 TaxID=2780089 RepID=UPI001D0B7110|nr:hypothetical protein [Pedobacter sp. MR2016-19]
MPEEAIRNFDEERAVNIIANTFQDDSVAYAENYKYTFNPLDKLMETVEEIKKLHAEKEALYECLLKAQENKCTAPKKLDAIWGHFYAKKVLSRI